MSRRIIKDELLGIFLLKCESNAVIRLVLCFTSIIATREEELKDGEEPHGHVTSISVLRPYRRLGLAKKLMVQSRTLLAFTIQVH